MEDVMKNQTFLLSLIRKTAAGDLWALEQLLHSQKSFITLVIRSHSSTPSVIDDISQEVAIRVFQKFSTLKHFEYFSSWLQTIVIHECNRYFATQRQIVPYGSAGEIEEALIETDPDCLPAECVESLDLCTELKHAIANMPIKTQYLLSLYYGTDMTYREIATFTGMTIGTVSSTLSRARKRLRETSEKY